MALIEINRDPSDRQLRQFAGIVLPLFAVLVATILWWRFDQGVVAVVALAAVAALGVVGCVRPRLVRPVYLAWLLTAYPLGWVIGHLVLCVVFYGVLTPIGLAMRLFGRDALQRTLDRQRSSYWERREIHRDKNRYFRQF